MKIRIPSTVAVLSTAGILVHIFVLLWCCIHLWAAFILPLVHQFHRRVTDLEKGGTDATPERLIPQITKTTRAKVTWLTVGYFGPFLAGPAFATWLIRLRLEYQNRPFLPDGIFDSCNIEEVWRAISNCLGFDLLCLTVLAYSTATAMSIGYVAKMDLDMDKEGMKQILKYKIENLENGEQ